MYSDDLDQTIRDTFRLAQQKRYKFLTTEILLYGLIGNEKALKALELLGADIEELKDELDAYISTHIGTYEESEQEEPRLSLAFERVLQRSFFQTATSQGDVVEATSVLIALFSEGESHAVYLLKKQDVHRIDLVNYVSHGITKQKRSNRRDVSDSGGDDLADALDVRNRRRERSSRKGQRRGRSEEAEGVEDALTQFATNLNEEAKKGKIDPLIGREHEVQRVLQVICRRRKNNPLLVGESGVGKTAIAEGLAKRIVDGEVPDVISDATIYAVDMGALLAGTRYRGDFEERFKLLLHELKEANKAIMFLDEIHTVIGAGSASGTVMDASNLLKPVLASGDVKCMGSTTYGEYRGIFEKDNALSRRFQKIDVPEPSVDDTYKILKGLKPHYEDYFHLRYTDPALKAAAELSAKYINDRFLPDKAIDVVDEAGAAQRLQPQSKRKKTVGSSDVEQIVAKIARIPSARVTSTDKVALQDLEQNLKMAVFGQEEAIATLSSAIRLARAGLKEPERPTGSFLFSGPTGVGKTEVCRQLARIMGVELVRFDMSEYMERHTVSRLIGAPPGYVGYNQGGLLTEQITKHPHSVLLLDEVEKAHPDVFNLLLQVMDYGMLTDNNGRKADFRNVVLVMTTNAGAQEAARASIGFTVQDHSGDSLAAINKLFTPEFRNRLDAIIQFNALPVEVIRTVVDKFLQELQTKLDAKGVEIQADDLAIDWLVAHGYDEKMGARPMQRLIQEKIKRPLADEILFGGLANGGGIAKISVEDDELVIHTGPHASKRTDDTPAELEKA